MRREMIKSGKKKIKVWTSFVFNVHVGAYVDDYASDYGFYLSGMYQDGIGSISPSGFNFIGCVWVFNGIDTYYGFNVTAPRSSISFDRTFVQSSATSPLFSFRVTRLDTNLSFSFDDMFSVSDTSISFYLEKSFFTSADNGKTISVKIEFLSYEEV